MAVQALSCSHPGRYSFWSCYRADGRSEIRRSQFLSSGFPSSFGLHFSKQTTFSCKMRFHNCGSSVSHRMRVHVRRRVLARPALVDELRDAERTMNCCARNSAMSRAMRRDPERRKNRCQKQRYVLLRASSASSQAFNSAQCLVCLTIIALRRSVSLRSYSRASLA